MKRREDSYEEKKTMACFSVLKYASMRISVKKSVEPLRHEREESRD